MDGFMMLPAQAEEFFERCQKENADTTEKRLKIMRQMCAERKAFHQTEEQLNKKLKGKKVLVVKPKGVKPKQEIN